MKAKKSSLPIGTKRKILASVCLILLIGIYASLFFIPGIPSVWWLRLLLALFFTPLMGTAIFFILKKHLTRADLEYIKDEENISRAIRAMKNAKFYTKPLPGFPKGVRRELPPTLAVSAVLFVFFLILSPGRAKEAPLPDFSKMAAAEFYYPYLFAASDSSVILAPPMLSDETVEWADKIPPKYLEWTMYTEIFQNHFEPANASGNLCETKTSGVYLAMAHASMLARDYPRAVTEFQQAIDAGNSDPAVAFQKAIAMAHAGSWKDAQKAMSDLNSKEVGDAIGDDSAVEHWQLVLDVLLGDLSDVTYEEYQEFYQKQSNLQAKLNQKKKKESAADEGSSKKDAAKASAQAEKETAKRKLQERRLRSASNNMSVLQVLQGDYENAVPTANAVLPLSWQAPERSQKIMRMCVMNTKGLAAGFLGKSFDDQAKKWDETAVCGSPEEYFTSTRTLFEEMLALSRLETDSVDSSYQRSPFYLLPWCNEAQTALRTKFTSKTFPDSDSFIQKYKDLFTLCGGLHKIWSKTEVSKIPVWAAAVENLLMQENLILEGRDTDEFYHLAVEICKEHLNKDEALQLLAVETRMKELQMLSRFAAKEGLAISMIDTLQDDQRKLVKDTKSALPENHALIARQALVTARLILMQKTLKKKDLENLTLALGQAEAILKTWNYPQESSIMLDLAAVKRLTNAMKKKEEAEIQEVFAAAIQENEANLFRQSNVYRDLGFALQHRGFISEADAANRSARTIFNQQIFRSNTRHFLLLQIDKILKH